MKKHPSSPHSPIRLFLAFTLLFGLCLSGTTAAQAQAGDTTGEETAAPPPPSYDGRLKVITPQAGQVFHPGDTVALTVSIDHALKPGSIYIEAFDDIVHFTWQPGGYTADAEIQLPKTFSGELALQPNLTDADTGQLVAGPPTTIMVQPAGQSLGIVATPDAITLKSLGETAQMKINSVYPDKTVTDVTKASAGTTYATRELKTLKIGPDGVVEALAYGTGVVSVTNNNFRIFVPVTVEDPAHPLAPEDISADFSISFPRIVFDPRTQLFTASLMVTNVKAEPVVGPLYFVLQGLPSKTVWLINGYGTRLVEPQNTWFIPLPLPNGSLAQGATLTLQLQFRTQKQEDIKFTSKILRSSNGL